MPEKSVGMELRCLSRQIKRFMQSNTNKSTVEEMTGTNSWIIGYVGEHRDRDVFQRDLEKDFGITRSTASKTVDSMVKKGFIERRGVDYDARLKKLVLTKKSEGVLDLMHEDRLRLEQQLTAGFSPDELRSLESYIQRLLTNLE